MEDGHDFVDYYDLLQVSPDCDEKILDIAYHHFAKIYHPDRPETANVDRFSVITDAYRLLRNPETRSQYDRQHRLHRNDKKQEFTFHSISPLGGDTALEDAKIHDKILHLLYNRRRENANDAGIVGWLLQEILECPEQQFEFHIWYLKSKGYLELTELGTLAITIQGVDHVIDSSLTDKAGKLLLSNTDNEDD